MDNQSNISLQQNGQQNANQQQSDDSLNLTDLFFISIHNWIWFVISLIVCLGLATFYYLRSIPVYEQSASITIKDDKKGSSATSDLSQTFRSMGIVQSNTNIKNELISIQSPDVALEVVKRMNLDISYYDDGTFHLVPIYASTLPITVVFPGIADMMNAGFDIELHPNGSYTLSNFYLGKDKVEGKHEGNLKNSVTNTPIGKISITRSPYYKKVTKDRTIHVKRTNLYSISNMVQTNFTAALHDKEATTIDITYKDLTRQKAADVLNTFIAVYNENWIKDKNEIAVSTSKFIDERLKVIEGELGNVDNNISSYKSRELIPDVASVSSMAMGVAQDANKTTVNLTNELYMARYIKDYISNSAHNSQVLPANVGINNPAISSQIQDYNSKLLMRNNLASNSSDTHPLVLDMDAALRGIRSSIITSLDNEIANLQEQIRAQQGVVGRATSQIASNPVQAKYLLSAERQQKVKENLYTFLLQKREENEINQAFTAYNTRVVAEPHGSLFPISPVKSKIFLIAFILGLAIPLGIIYWRESTNTKVRGKKDLDDVLTIPYLGEIPQVISHRGQKSDADRVLTVKNNSRKVIDEAFRVVRTNIDFTLSADRQKNVIIITSFNPGSGKTFLCMNLAASFAMINKKVLAIDCDLRRLSLSEYVDRPTPGISDYLVGAENDINKCIVKHPDQEGLYVLPVGTMPPNPTELILLPKFGELIQKLRTQYDYILMDCPPVDIIADTSIIEKNADRTIFVMRSGLMEKSMLKVLEANYKDNKFKSMSIILNGTQSIGGRYGYSYGYRYGYGYGYGYGEYGSTKHKKHKSLWHKVKKIFKYKK